MGSRMESLRAAFGATPADTGSVKKGHKWKSADELSAEAAGADTTSVGSDADTAPIQEKKEREVDPEKLARKQERAEKKKDFDERRSDVLLGIRWPFMIAIALLIIGYAVFSGKFGGLFGGGDSSPVLGLRDLELRERFCLATETVCSGGAQCRGGNGQLANPAAKTPTGDHCCTFTCENEVIPVRLCKSGERMCPPGQACRMGTTIKGVNAITPSGESCCTFACNSTEPESRNCFASETLCAASSLCYGYTGSVTQPSATNSVGVCCAYSGDKEACSIPH